MKQCTATIDFSVIENFCHSVNFDCGLNHMRSIWSEADFHGKSNGVDCKTIR